MSKISISIDPLWGIRDFYPDDMRCRSYIFGLWRSIGNQFGYHEYDAALLERQELYTRKAGEEITAQMYNFVDKDGNSVSLRPEMTPSLVRMVMSKLVANADSLVSAEVLPLKWFSIPQCWRFETPQKGRKREHYQWNMDIIGSTSVSSEMDLLCSAIEFFKRCGVTSSDVVFKVNSRRILGDALKKAQVPDELFARTCVVIDKYDKLGDNDQVRHKAVKSLLIEEVGLEEAVCEQVLATRCLTLDGIKGLDGGPELLELFSLAEGAGVSEWLQFDPTVVRGLAYYTGIVWEGFTRQGGYRALTGGGRYDKLFTLYGSPHVVPCVGFGFGDCVITEFLKEKGLLSVPSPKLSYLVVPFKGLREEAFGVLTKLRAAGYSADIVLDDLKIKKMFSYADRVGAERVVFVAPDEFGRGCVRVKDLRAGTEDKRIEVEVPMVDIEKIDGFFQ